MLDIYVMVNWHLSKQGTHWPVSCDDIAGSSLEVIEVSCFFFIFFFKLTADQVLVFDWMTGSSQVNLFRTPNPNGGLLFLLANSNKQPGYSALMLA